MLGNNNQIPNGAGKGNVQLDGTFNLNGFSDTINGLAGSGKLDGVSGTPTFTVGDGNASGSNFSGLITDTAGSLTIVKIGTGDQTFSGANNYSGSTQVNAGRLVLSGAGTLGSGSVTVASGGEAYIATGTTLNNDFFISGDGGNSIDPQPRGALRIESNSVIGSGGSVTLQADASIGTYNNNTGIVNAVIGEAGGSRALSINKSGANAPGTIVLGGANTFTGDTRVNNGTLRLANTLALQDSTLDMNGADSGTLSFGSLTSSTFGGLKGSRDLALQNGSAAAVALSIGNSNQSNTYSGQLSGPGSLTKMGTGTQTFSGNNNYTGTTNVNAGELIINGSTSGQGDYTVASGARLGGNGSIGANVIVSSMHGDLSPGDKGSLPSGSAPSGSSPFSFSYSAGTDPLTVGSMGVGGDVDLGGFLLLDLTSSGHDMLNVAGDFEIVTNPNAQLEVNGTTDLTEVNFWDILGWTAPGPSTDLVTFNTFGGGEFDNIAFNETFTDAGGHLVLFGLDNDSIFLAAVPEPASIAIWSLLGLTLGGFGYRRMRAKK